MNSNPQEAKTATQTHYKKTKQHNKVIIIITLVDPNVKKGGLHFDFCGTHYQNWAYI